MLRPDTRGGFRRIITERGSRFWRGNGNNLDWLFNSVRSDQRAKMLRNKLLGSGGNLQRDGRQHNAQERHGEGGVKHSRPNHEARGNIFHAKCTQGKCGKTCEQQRAERRCDEVSQYHGAHMDERRGNHGFPPLVERCVSGFAVAFR